MLLQAQNPVLTGQVTYDAPLGAMLAIALLVLAAGGVLFESGAFGSLVGWLGAAFARRPHPVATASHRG